MSDNSGKRNMTGMQVFDISGEGNPWKKEEDVSGPAVLLLTGFLADARLRFGLFRQSTSSILLHGKIQE